MARRKHVTSTGDITWAVLLLVAGQALHDGVWHAVLDASGRSGGVGPDAEPWIGDIVSLVGLVLLVTVAFSVAATADRAAGPAAADTSAAAAESAAADGSTSAGDIRAPGR